MTKKDLDFEILSDQDVWNMGYSSKKMLGIEFTQGEDSGGALIYPTVIFPKKQIPDLIKVLKKELEK